MTKVICPWICCRYNKEEICEKEEIILIDVAVEGEGLEVLECEDFHAKGIYKTK